MLLPLAVSPGGVRRQNLPTKKKPSRECMTFGYRSISILSPCIRPMLLAFFLDLLNEPQLFCHLFLGLEDHVCKADCQDLLEKFYRQHLR